MWLNSMEMEQGLAWLNCKPAACKWYMCSMWALMEKSRQLFLQHLWTGCCWTAYRYTPGINWSEAWSPVAKTLCWDNLDPQGLRHSGLNTFPWVAPIVAPVVIQSRSTNPGVYAQAIFRIVLCTAREGAASRWIGRAFKPHNMQAKAGSLQGDLTQRMWPQRSAWHSLELWTCQVACVDQTVREAAAAPWAWLRSSCLILNFYGLHINESSVSVVYSFMDRSVHHWCVGALPCEYLDPCRYL